MAPGKAPRVQEAPGNVVQVAIAERIVDEARRLGFDLVGIAPPAPPETLERYQTWSASGFHGEMAYLARPDAAAKRADLSLIQPGLRSVVTVGANYRTVALPPDLRDDPSRGIFAATPG